MALSNRARRLPVRFQVAQDVTQRDTMVQWRAESDY